MYTIAICDTEPIAVEGIRSLLESSEAFSVVSTDSSLLDAVESVRALRPSILLVDKAFGLGPVMEWLETMRLSRSATAVVVWGSWVSASESLRLLHAGAAGVIRKSVTLPGLLACLRTVAGGGSWVEDDFVTRIDRPVRSGHSPLTSREMQVMDLVERGLRNKDIGEALGISAGTVKIHLKHIFEKTGVRGRYGLAVSGLREKGVVAPATAVVA